MPRTAPNGLSKHPRDGYRITIGKKPNGKPRLFWLGKVEFFATYHAGLLRDRFSVMKSRGRDIWSDDDVRTVNDWINAARASMSALLNRRTADLVELDQKREEHVAFDRVVTGVLGEVKTSPLGQSPIAEVKPATLYAAIDAFLESFDGKRRSDRHKERMRQVLEKSLKRIRPDMPLHKVDFLWLDTLCDHFKNRPANAKDGKPLSVASVLSILRYMRLFFVWLDDTNFQGWEMPRRGLKCFRARASDLHTPAEIRAAATIEQFDVDTLKKIYRVSNDHQRSIILTAMLTGATQNELAQMTKDEFDFDKAMLTHVRIKTKVIGKYWLPPELIKLLKAEFKSRPKDTLAWRTEEGNPLVTYANNRQVSDAVRQMWDDLRDRAKLPNALSFKFLRKFLADFCVQHGGSEIAQVALSHSSQTVLAKNYSQNRPFDRFHEVQRKLHAELAAAGFFGDAPAPAPLAIAA